MHFLEFHQERCNAAKFSYLGRIQQRNHKKGRRRSLSWTAPSLLVWVSLIASLNYQYHTAVRAQDGFEEGLGQKPDDRNQVTPEQKAELDEFLLKLQSHSYLQMLVKEGSTTKAAARARRPGPPVTIGRRRALLEHRVQHHYSLQFLRQSSQKSNISSDNETQENRLRAAVDAYLFQTRHDASLKANPQRLQHDAATSNFVGMPPFPPSLKKANIKLLRDMFYTSYNAYMKHSFPAAELKPLTCKPGTFDLVRLPALTLIDALDTLLVLKDSVEFARSVERLRQLDMEHKTQDDGGIFAVDQNVSVFETSIRVLGGLLSAHQMALAFLKNPETSEGSNKMSPVFLADVYNHPDDPYLQRPEEVQRKLEEYQKKLEQYAMEQADQRMGQGVCPIKTSSGESDGPERNDNNKDWRADQWADHCGSGVFAFEDCTAIANDKCKLLNRTRAKKMDLIGLEPRWEYDGFLLQLAKDIGERLLPAFETRTGIPYGTVNLLHGIPKGETTVASLAGGGTLSLEMELLSRLTGDLRFGQAAKLAIRALWLRRSSLHLVGKHIDVHRGVWTETLSGIGSNSDSFLEYLLKHYLLFPEEEDFWIMLQAAYTGIFNDARLGEWYADVDMKTGLRHYPKGLAKPVLESLMAFYPGMQTLLGELVPAARSMNSFFMAREFVGFLPERFSYVSWKVDGGISSGAAKHPLRPELLESSYFMHRATRQKAASSETSSAWLWASDYALHHLERLTRAPCGYASVRRLNPATGHLNVYQNMEQVRLFNEMPSFFLSETIKYLYLTFDDDNILHDDKDHDWIFTTEAHPIHTVPKFDQRGHEAVYTRSRSDPEHLADVKAKLRKKVNALKRQRSLGKKGDNHPQKFANIELSAAHRIISATYLQEESWTDSTQPRAYRNSLFDVAKEITEENRKMIGATPESEHPLATFFGNGTDLLYSMELGHSQHLFREKDNLAHLTLNSLGRGTGYSLKKACPNFNAPELLWVHALGGGAIDYTDVYVSAMSEADDDYPSPSESSRLLLTSAEALSVHGSGVYLGTMETEMNENEQCPVAGGRLDRADTENIEPRPGTAASYSASEFSKNEKAAKDEARASNVQHVKLVGLGTFEVSAFPEGSGFFMQRLETGESIVATFIAENVGESSEGLYFMAHASMPRRKAGTAAGEHGEGMSTEENLVLDEATGENKTVDGRSPWNRMGPKLASLFRNAKKKGRQEEEDPGSTQEWGEPERAVVLADLFGNAFHCEVNIVRKALPLTRESMEGDEQGVGHESREDIVVASFPCAPALFGPTHLSRLAATNGVFVEHTVFAPETNDEFGCTGGHVTTETGTRSDGIESSQGADIIDRFSSDGNTDKAQRVVQVVRRGNCSFFAKTANQLNRVNAEAVIVINHENELFIMSSGEDDSEINEEELPAGVLITSIDGDELLELLESESKEDSSGRDDPRTYLVAQISILKQETMIDASGSIVSPPHETDIDWPLVRGSEDALQIFAEGGWGVHAVRREGGSMRQLTGHGDLQLYLLRHSNSEGGDQ